MMLIAFKSFHSICSMMLVLLRGEERCMQGFVGRSEGKSPLRRIGINYSIIFKWTFKL